MDAYYFVAATLIAVFPILVVFKIMIEKVRENPEEHAKLVVRFIIIAAVIEVIPILLIILGMINLEQVNDISELYLPGAIVILSYVFAFIFISIQRVNDTEVNTARFRVISLALAGAIPIVSIVCMATMLPSV